MFQHVYRQILLPFRPDGSRPPHVAIWMLIGLVCLSAIAPALLMPVSMAQAPGEQSGATHESHDEHAEAPVAEPNEVADIVETGPPPQTYAYGVVLSVEDKGPLTQDEGGLFSPVESMETLQLVKVRLTSDPAVRGIERGDVVTAEMIQGENPAYNINVRPGNRVLLNLERSPVKDRWVFYVASRDRTPALIILGTLLLLAVLLIGGSEVAKHLLLAVMLLLATYKLLFPAIMSGQGVLFWTLLLCTLFTVLASFVYQNPQARAFSREQMVVIIGSLGGLAMLGAMVAAMHVLAALNGFTDEGLASLWYVSQQVDYWGMYVASILIGYQGFIFYLVWMLAQNRGDPLGFRERFGITILRGRRLLGPMLSSLALVFLGLYAPLLLQMQGTPASVFANLEKTASVITFAFAGGLTLVLLVPLTALISAWLLSAKKAG